MFCGGLLILLILILIPIQIRMQNMELEMLIYVVLSTNFDGCFGGALIIMIIIQNLCLLVDIVIYLFEFWNDFGDI